MKKRHYTVTSPGRDDLVVYGTAKAAQRALRQRHDRGENATMARTPRAIVREGART